MENKQVKGMRNLRKAGIAAVVLAASVGLTSFTMDRPIQFPESLNTEDFLRLSEQLELSHTSFDKRYPTIDEVVFDDFKIEQSLQHEVDATVKDWLKYHKNDIIAQIANVTLYDDFITSAAKKHKLPKSRLYSLVRKESFGLRTQVSDKGAAGLTQLMEEVAKVNFKMPLNKYVDYRFFPRENIRAGFAHLSYMYESLNKNWILAYIGYNAGREIAKKYVGKSWLAIKAGLIKSGRKETVDFIIENFALNSILLNPASYDVMIEKKPPLSQITMEHTIKPHETISSIMKKYKVSYDNLKFYNKFTHKAFNQKIGLKEGYIMLIPQKQ